MLMNLQSCLIPRCALAVVAVSIALAAAPARGVTILDSYTNRVPTGTSYLQLEFYDQYVDAGSVDASPFVLTRTTTGNYGGIRFYGSTELISQGDANTFRLTSTTGAFDFTSFVLDELRAFPSFGGVIPTLTITSSLGQTQTWSGEGYFGVQTMNWSGVDWVDFTSQYTKAFVHSLEVTAVPEPSTWVMGLAGIACAGWGAYRRRRASQTRVPTPAFRDPSSSKERHHVWIDSVARYERSGPTKTGDNSHMKCQTRCCAIAALAARFAVAVLALVVFAAVCVTNTAAAGIIITPSSAAVLGGWSGVYGVRTIDGSGLSDATLVENGDTIPSPYPTHVGTNGSAGWRIPVARDTDGNWIPSDSMDAVGSVLFHGYAVSDYEIAFDLGSPQTLTGIHVWNYVYSESGEDSAGARAVTAWVSNDPLAWGSPTFLTYDFPHEYTGVTRTLSGTGQYVLLKITANTAGGYGSDQTGFQEVRFIGSAVPEPSTWVMGLAGIACGGWQMFRRHKRRGGRYLPRKLRAIIVSVTAVTQRISLVALASSNHDKENVMPQLKHIFSLILAASALVASAHAEAAPIRYDITNATTVQNGYSLSGYIEVSGTGSNATPSSFNLTATKEDNPTFTFSSVLGDFTLCENLIATDSFLYVPDAGTLQIVSPAGTQSLNWVNNFYNDTLYNALLNNVAPYTVYWSSESYPITDENGWRIGSVQGVPEPSTYAMALAGLACGGYSVFRRRKRA
jgi:hypothetical protein